MLAKKIQIKNESHNRTFEAIITEINEIHGIEMSTHSAYMLNSMLGLTIIFDCKSMIFQVFCIKAVSTFMTSTIWIWMAKINQLLNGPKF